MERELIDNEVYELGALKAYQPLYFGASFDRTLVVDEPTHHELGHDSGLDADPYFFYNVTRRARVLRIVFIRIFCYSKLNGVNAWHDLIQCGF